MRIFLVVSCLLVVVSLSGCGEKIESTTYYYSPSWTKGGDIVFIKGLQTVRKDALGSQLGSSYTEAVMTMTVAGASETLQFDVTSAPSYSMTYSPSPLATSDYIAYLDDLQNTTFGKLVIRNVAAGVHRGLDKIELVFSPRIKSFDWSNDGTKLVYCTTQEIHTVTVNIDGTVDTLVTAEANLSFVSWKNGGRIAFVHTVGSATILSFIYPDGSGRLDLAAAASVDKPQISATNTSEVYGFCGSSYCKVDVSVGTPATTEITTNFKGNLPRLSPAADKIVYSKTGTQSGIYLLDLSTKAETQVK